MFRKKIIYVLFISAFIIGTLSISGCGSSSDNGINLQDDVSNSSNRTVTGKDTALLINTFPEEYSTCIFG